jgi:hypothetical protein
MTWFTVTPGDSKGVIQHRYPGPDTLYDEQMRNFVDFGLARRINNKRYTTGMDFAFSGDFLLPLHYSSFGLRDKGKHPWYDE